MSTTSPSPERIAFGAKVRALREERGWSQESFAMRCGLHRTYISSVEQGRRNLALDNIVAIARAFDVAPGDLFDPR